MFLKLILQNIEITILVFFILFYMNIVFSMIFGIKKKKLKTKQVSLFFLFFLFLRTDNNF